VRVHPAAEKVEVIEGMSTEESKAVVRRFVAEVINRADQRVLNEIVHEEFVRHHGSGQPPEEGRDRYTRHLIARQEIFRGGQFKEVIEDLIAEDDLAVFRWTSLGITSSGESVNTTGITIVRVSEGALVEAWESSTPTMVPSEP
jgi:hypothetical protein